MADAVTLSAMIADCRRLSDQETIDQTQALCTDADITARLNRHLHMVYRELVAARGGSYYRKTYTFNTVAGTVEYAFPADFMQLLGVTLTINGEVRALADATEAEVPALESARMQYPERYQLRQGFLALLPTPTSGVSVKLTYVPSFVSLVVGTDTFEGVAGFEQMAVQGVVIEMLAKDQQDPSLAMAERDGWMKHIRSMAPRRDAARPMRIQRRYAQRWGRSE